MRELPEVIQKGLDAFYKGSKKQYSPSDIRRVFEKRPAVDASPDEIKLYESGTYDDGITIAGGEELVKQYALPKRGFNKNSLESRPGLFFDGMKYDIATDGFLLLRGNGAREFLSSVADKVHETKDMVKMPIARYEELIPHTEKRFKNELRVVGVSLSSSMPKVWLADKDGKNAMAVNLDLFAWLRERLPDARLYGTGKTDIRMRENEYGEIERDDKGSAIWDTTVDPSKLEMANPLSFVIEGKTQGLAMPVFVKEVPKGLGISDETIHHYTSENKHKDPLAERVKARRSYAKSKGEDSSAITALRGLYGEIFEGYKSLDDAKKEFAESEGTTAGIYTPAGRRWDRELFERAILRAEKHPELTPFGVTKLVTSSTKTDPKTVAKGATRLNLQSIESSRSPRSRESDERQRHSIVINSDDPRVDKWRKDPGAFDVRGVDTPRKRKSGKARKSRHTDTTVGRIGK